MIDPNKEKSTKLLNDVPQIGIPMSDFIIIGNGLYYSFYENLAA